MGKWAREFCNKVWKKKSWKKGITVSIVKKGREEIEKYRRVTLIPTLCKIYAIVLAEKIKEDYM